MRFLKISNLDNRNVTQASLFHEYKKYGTIFSLVLSHHDRDHDHKKYAIIAYKNTSDALTALDETHGKRFLGFTLNVQLVQQSEIDKDILEKIMSRNMDHTVHHPLASRTLFIGNLPNYARVSELNRIFSKYGTIIDIEIKTSFNQSQPAYAFVQFDSIDAVVKSIRKVDGDTIGDNKIKCGFGKTQVYKVIWIGDLPERYCDERRLDDLLYEYRLHHEKIFINKNIGQALVYFPNTDYARTGIHDAKNIKIEGKKMRVDYASDKLVDYVRKTGYSNRDKESLSPDSKRRKPSNDSYHRNEKHDRKRSDERESDKDSYHSHGRDMSSSESSKRNRKDDAEEILVKRSKKSLDKFILRLYRG